MSSRKWDDRFLRLADFVSVWSKDPSTQVGAVITDEDNRIVSIGYNGFPKGINDDHRLYDRETKYSMIVHAEINAILFANRSLKECTLYTFPFLPCPQCASIIIQTGIKRIVAPQNLIERWEERIEESRTLFKQAKLEIVEI